MTTFSANTIRMTNAKFAATNEEFQKACAKAKVEPTARQASKWLSKKGAAWKNGREEKREGN